MSSSEHRPVLLAEVLALLIADRNRPGSRYLDATFGRGGHSRALLESMPADGTLYVLDRDPQAIAAADQLAALDPRVTVLRSRLSAIDEALRLRELPELGTLELHGVLIDLGVSSPQLDDPERGFSFQHDGPLDMRMDNSSGESAADWLARVTEVELVRTLQRYGEQPAARRIARAIIAARPLTDTRRLAAVVSDATPAALRRKAGARHPATQTFQAIRMQVNDELAELESALPQLFTALALGGRLAVISFHSLEDRIVKRFFRAQVRRALPPRRLPVAEADIPPAPARQVAGPVRAGAAELAANPRARSAVLRVLERTA